jgi:hypothetical protein
LRHLTTVRGSWSSVIADLLTNYRTLLAPNRLWPENILAAMIEERVGGGGVTDVSRVDGTIRRTTGWWSEAVHALLGYLEASGFDRSPRFLGIDVHGREVLSELPGRPCLGPGLDGDTLLVSAAGLVRRYHDLVAGWSYPADSCSASVWADVLAAIPDRVEAAYLTTKTWAAEGGPGWAEQWEQAAPWSHGAGYLRDLQWLRTDPVWQHTDN